MRRMYSKGQLEELIKEFLEKDVIRINAFLYNQEGKDSITLNRGDVLYLTGLAQSSIQILSSVPSSCVIFAYGMDSSKTNGMMSGSIGTQASISFYELEEDEIFIYCTLEGNLVVAPYVEF